MDSRATKARRSARIPRNAGIRRNEGRFRSTGISRNKRFEFFSTTKIFFLAKNLQIFSGEEAYPEYQDRPVCPARKATQDFRALQDNRDLTAYRARKGIAVWMEPQEFPAEEFRGRKGDSGLPGLPGQDGLPGIPGMKGKNKNTFTFQLRIFFLWT